MKKQIKLFLLIMPLAMVLLFAACKKEIEGGKGEPKIERLRTLARTDTIKNAAHVISFTETKFYDDYRLVRLDSTVTQGSINFTYAIIGENLRTTKSITINGVPAYFNPALVTDNSVIVGIPENTPYGPTQSKILTLVTNYGSVNYTFPIKQPTATITSFTPLAAGAGEIVTIIGTVFDNLLGVKFDDTPAEIVGIPTKTEIKVKVPAGVVQSFIYVTTPAGISKSVTSFGFRRLVYDDALQIGWAITSYNATTVNQTVNPKRGTSSLKTLFTGGFGAFRLNYNGAAINVSQSGLTALKFSVYGGPGSAGKKIAVCLNNNYNNRIQLVLSEGAYTDFTVPLSAFGSPTTITEIVVQEFSGFSNSVIYIDDLGFI